MMGILQRNLVVRGLDDGRDFLGAGDVGQVRVRGLPAKLRELFQCLSFIGLICRKGVFYIIGHVANSVHGKPSFANRGEKSVNNGKRFKMGANEFLIVNISNSGIKERLVT